MHEELTEASVAKAAVAKAAAAEAAKALPPVAMLAAEKAESWTMNDTLTAITILYVVLQILWLVWKWRAAIKSRGAADEKDVD